MSVHTRALITLDRIQSTRVIFKHLKSMVRCLETEGQWGAELHAEVRGQAANGG